jgi:hypothetical protein
MCPVNIFAEIEYGILEVKFEVLIVASKSSTI